MQLTYSKLLRRGGLLLGLLLLLGLTAHAGPNVQEFTKTLNKQAPIASDGLVDLENKYGKIDIKTWNQEQVRISVKITVEARNESAAQEVFDRISIDFFNNITHVGATTQIEAQSSWWNWGNSRSDFSIDYEVHMPAGCRLEVDAKYCDVYAMAVNGAADVSVKYGNFKLDGLGEDATIELAYGNGTIRTARDLNIDLAYGNLDVGEAGDITLGIKYGNLESERAGDIRTESRYSNFILGDIGEFRVEGKYDNYQIRTATEIVLATQYSNLEVGRLSRRLDLDMSYGAVKAHHVEAGFSEVNLLGRYTDFKVYIDGNTSCSIDLAGDYADMSVPSNLQTSYDHRDGKTREIRGTMGSGGNAIVKARLSYGGIVLGRD